MKFQNHVSPIVRVIPGQYAGLPSQFEGIRTTIRIDQSWFVLSDTLEAMGMTVPEPFRTPTDLDINDPMLVVELLEEDRRAAYLVEPESGLVVASLISEPELYGLIQSRPASHDLARIEPIERTVRVLPRLTSGDRSSWEPPQVFLGTADIDSGFSMDLPTEDL